MDKENVVDFFNFHKCKTFTYVIHRLDEVCCMIERAIEENLVLDVTLWAFTLESGINIRVRLLIFKGFFQGLRPY